MPFAAIFLELTTVAPRTLWVLSWSFLGSVSLIEYVAASKVGLAAVMVHDVLALFFRCVGVHTLVSVTAAWPRTIVTGMRTTRWPP